MSDDIMDNLLSQALEQARIGLRDGGIPIGSVLAKDGNIVGRGHNMRVQNNDPTAHAEIECLRNSGRIGTFKQTVLYSTLMPCYLCAGAAVQFGIRKVVVGESKNFSGAKEFMQAHGIEIIDLNSTECIEMMHAFIINNPTLWLEDIGNK